MKSTHSSPPPLCRRCQRGAAAAAAAAVPRPTPLLPEHSKPTKQSPAPAAEHRIRRISGSLVHWHARAAVAAGMHHYLEEGPLLPSPHPLTSRVSFGQTLLSLCLRCSTLFRSLHHPSKSCSPSLPPPSSSASSAVSVSLPPPPPPPSFATASAPHPQVAASSLLFPPPHFYATLPPPPMLHCRRHPPRAPTTASELCRGALVLQAVCSRGAAQVHCMPPLQRYR